LVTLEEMYDMFSSDDYKPFREDWGLDVETLPNGNRFVYTTLSNIWLSESPLLYQHIIAEEFLRHDFDSDKWDWEQYKSFNPYDPHVYIKLLWLWKNPLVWMNTLCIKDAVVFGRLAMELDDRNLFYNKRDALIENEFNKLFVGSLMRFADNPPLYDSAYFKGIHDWSLLTSDYLSLESKVKNGTQITEKDYDDIHPYDAEVLRYQLVIIAHYNSRRAAELLRMLQKEWKDIKRWKILFESTSESVINTFEETLFNGFDDLLAEWEPSVVEKKDKAPVKAKKGKEFEPELITFTKLKTAEYNMVALYQSLIKMKWIEDGNPDDFTALFSGRISDSKVVWSGKVGKDNLYALFDMMVTNQFIKVPDGHSMQRIVESHFVDKSGNYVVGINSGKPSQKALQMIEELRKILLAQQTFED